MSATITYETMRPGEHNEVIDLIRRVFMHDVAPQYSKEGVREFLSYAGADALLARSKENHLVVTAKKDMKIVGAIEVRNCTHVSMLFVDLGYQRNGIGRKLLHTALEICRTLAHNVSTITVNSSPNAVEAYERFGFTRQGELQVKNGIGFVPMVLKDTFLEAH